MRNSLLLVMLLLITFFLHAQEEDFYTLKKDTTGKSFYQLSISDLYNLKVTTASNAIERLQTAPANIIVINEEEIRSRGYLEVYDVLNDLPGFDLSRAFGDDHYYAYARGYRKTLSDQMLFMVDGVILNFLYNNNMNAYLQYPMYNVKQIEVVYGPASAVYGANAFSGVINIITKQDGESTVMVTKGGGNSNLVEVNLSKKVEKLDGLTLTLAGRFYATEGHDLSNRHPLMTDTLFTSPQLWGPFLQTGFTGYQNPASARFLYGTIQYKELTIGIMNWMNSSGLGAEFPADRALNSPQWQFDESTIYAKYNAKIGQLNSRTLFRMRQSGNPESSMFISSWNTGYDGTKYASYWATTNRAYSLFQDFTYPVMDNLSANFGVKYYYRTLQRDYDINNGIILPNDTTGVDPFAGLVMPNRQQAGQINHDIAIDQGAYMQLKYSPISNLDLIGGVRFDYNNIWEEVISPRLGLVYTPVKGLVAKAFYGTAFLEPSFRVLYGGWQGSLANPDLRPERMRTFETSLSYTQQNYAVGGSFYFNNGIDAISQVDGVPVNLGSNRAIGVDIFAKYLYRPGLSALDRLKIDAYISWMRAEESLDVGADFVTTGNMAPLKVHLMATATFNKRLDISLQTRYISDRPTVASNPIETVGGFFVADANVLFRDFPFKGLTIGAKVYNLLNTDYFHPGYRDASAGETLYDGAGNYVGSQGWYSSRLPQPFRTGHITLRVDF